MGFFPQISQILDIIVSPYFLEITKFEARLPQPVFFASLVTAQGHEKFISCELQIQTVYLTQNLSGVKKFIRRHEIAIASSMVCLRRIAPSP
jgi:hypothetical protein